MKKSNDRALEDLINLLNRQGLGKSPLRICEIGCGNGARISEFSTLIPKRHSLVATDIFLDRPASLSPLVKYHRQDVHSLSFDNNSFDVVFSVAVSEHYLDTIQAFHEQLRVLRPGGILYVIHTPFYSCSKGHHNHFSSRHCMVFPPYGHLHLDRDAYLSRTLSRNQTLQYFEESDISLLVDRLYERKDLSRLTYNSYMQIRDSLCAEVLFSIDHLDVSYDEVFAEKALESYLKSNMVYGELTLDTMRIEKMRCALIKE